MSSVKTVKQLSKSINKGEPMFNNKGIADTPRMKDIKGREWDFTINLNHAYMIDRSDYSDICPEMESDLSFLNPSRELFMTLLTNTKATFFTMWIIVRDEARKLPAFQEIEERIKGSSVSPDITPEDLEDALQMEFVSGFDAEKIEEAKAAFWRAVSDFFPGQKTVFSELLSSLVKAGEKMDEATKKLLPEMGEIIGEETDKFLQDQETKFREMRNERDGKTSSKSSGTSSSPEVAGGATPSES